MSDNIVSLGRRQWSEDEIAFLVEHGPEAASEHLEGRSWHSCRSKYNKLGLYLSEQKDVQPLVSPEYREPQVTQIVGVRAGEAPDLEEIRRRAEAQYERTAKLAERKQHQHVYFDHGPVAFFFVGDNHIGNPGANVSQMFEEQEQILATPGARVVLMGDLVDNMVVGKLMAANLNHRTTNNEDWELARHYVERWGDRVIAYVGGNHTGGWTMRMLGLDLDKTIAPDTAIYDLDDVRFTAHIGNHEVSIWARHKWQGSSIYSATHGQERAARFDTARHDVYVGAHIHRGAVAREFVVDRKRKLALLSSTYKHHDSFQRQEGFAANDMSTAVGLVINNDGSFWGSGNIHAIMNYMKQVYGRAA